MARNWTFLFLLLISASVWAAPSTTVLERYGTSAHEQVENDVRLPRDFWTRDKVLAGIKLLLRHRRDICLLNKVLLDDTSLRTATIMRSAFGRLVTGSKLVIAARTFFFNWPQAIEAAGMRYEDLEVLYGTRVWTRARIITAIRFLESFGIDIGTTAMGHDKRLVTETLLTTVFGYKFNGSVETIGGQALYKAACDEFGNWPKALLAAGVNPTDWNRRGAWSERAIIAVIRKFYSLKIPLNVWAVIRDNSSQTLDIIEANAHYRSSGSALVQAAVRQFGSWDDALRSARIDPAKVRRYRASGLGGFSIASQLELSTGADGETCAQKFYGVASREPSAIAASAEFLAMLLKATEGLEEKERTLIADILEVVVTSDGFSSPASISKTLRKNGISGSNAAEVRDALNKIKGLAIAI